MADPGFNATACAYSVSTPCNNNTTTSDELPQHVLLILVCGGLVFAVLAFVILCLRFRGKCKPDGNESGDTGTGNEPPLCTIQEDGTMLLGGEIVPLSALPPPYNSLNFSDPYVRRALQRSISTISDLPPSYSCLDARELISENVSQIATDINCIIESTETENPTNNATENDQIHNENDILNVKQIEADNMVSSSGSGDTCCITVEGNVANVTSTDNSNRSSTTNGAIASALRQI